MLQSILAQVLVSFSYVILIP